MIQWYTTNILLIKPVACGGGTNFRIPSPGTTLRFLRRKHRNFLFLFLFKSSSINIMIIYSNHWNKDVNTYEKEMPNFKKDLNFKKGSLKD